MFDLKANHRLLFLGLMFALLFAPSTFAQTVTGTMQGTVSDSKGAVVPGADVVIRNLETGQERTSENGWRRLLRRTVPAVGPLHGDGIKPRLQ